MDSVNQRSKSDKNLKHNDYDMFEFRAQNHKISNHYVFQTRGNFKMDDLKSQTVILIT